MPVESSCTSRLPVRSDQNRLMRLQAAVRRSRRLSAPKVEVSEARLTKVLGVNQLLEIMHGDKKARDGSVRFALPEGVGRMHPDSKQGWTVPVGDDLVRVTLGGYPRSRR